MGGARESYSSFFIILPTTYLFSGYFLRYIVNYIYQKQPNKSKKDEKEEKEKIKNCYLSRVSHLGIYNLYEKIDGIQGGGD